MRWRGRLSIDYSHRRGGNQYFHCMFLFSSTSKYSKWWPFGWQTDSKFLIVVLPVRVPKNVVRIACITLSILLLPILLLFLALGLLLPLHSRTTNNYYFGHRFWYLVFIKTYIQTILLAKYERRGTDFRIDSRPVLPQTMVPIFHRLAEAFMASVLSFRPKL